MKAIPVPAEPELQAPRSCLPMLLASDTLSTSGWQEGDVLCAGAGSVPGGVGSLQVSFDAGELWAHGMLYLLLSLFSALPRAVSLSGVRIAAVLP